MQEDSDLEGRYRFRIGRRDQIVLFKKKGESASHVQLKAIAYALFFRDCQNLQMSPRFDYRIQPDLAAIDLEGKPEIWIHCGNGRNLEQDLEYICKHVPAREVVLVAEELDTDSLVERLKKKVHYRYSADKLKVINFHPPVADWLDPDNVDVPSDSYTVVAF